MVTPLSLLLFGDNPNDALFVSNELTRHGVHAKVSWSNGKVDEVASEPYSAVYVSNPPIGCERDRLLGSIRRRWCRAPVILLIDQSQDDEVAKLLESGLVDFIVRSLADITDLLAITWMALKLSGERDSGVQLASSRSCRLDQSVAGFFRCYGDGRLFDLNATLAGLLGFRTREAAILADHSLWGDAVPSQLQRTTEVIPIEFQTRLQRIDKKQCWGRLRVWPVMTAAGVTVAYEGWAEDMTQCHLCHAGLRETSSIHRAVLDSSAAAISIMDEKGAFVAVNAEFERISGYSKQEILGKLNAFAFVPSDEQKRVEKSHALQMAASAIQPATYERRFVNRVGEVRETQVTVQRVAGTKRVLEAIVDITDQRRMDRKMKLLAEGMVVEGDDVFTQLAVTLLEALDADAVVIAAALDGPPLSLCTLGAAGCGKATLGSELSPQNSHWAELILGKRLLSVCTSDARVVHSGDRWLEDVKADSFIALPVFAQDGRRIGLIASASGRPLHRVRFQKYAMQLVAKKVAVERERRTSQLGRHAGVLDAIAPSWVGEVGLDGATNRSGLLSAALDQTADQVLITDSEGVICYVNRAFTVETGYARDEAIGRTPRMLRSGEHPVEFYRELWRRLHAGEVFQGEFINRNKQGSLFWEAKTITPILNRAGEITYFVSTGRNITEQKRIEEQSRHTQRLEAVGRLAGGVAHDFNNLLTAIMGFSSLALTSLGDDHPAKNDLGQIRRAGERAAALTRQLLAFSRRQILTPQVLDLNEVVESLEQMLRRLIPETIILRSSLLPEVGRIMADRDQIEMVLVNLVVNARDAMPDGGHLTVRTDRQPPVERTSAPFKLDGPLVHLSVSDDGCGMDAETKQHIFDPFFTTKPVDKGTGLGLATVYGIVAQSGGFITVESEPGRGSTFNIYLPHVNEPLSPLEAKAPVNFEGGDETILLVEDDDDIRKFAIRALRERGYTVYSAENGLAAQALLDRASAPQIDLLITDVVMPFCGGVELVAALRQTRPQLPVLFMSGYTESHLDLSGLQRGEIHSLHKPFGSDTLLGKVHHVLAVTRRRWGEDGAPENNS